MRNATISLVVVLGLAPCGWAGMAGIETLFGTFEVSAGAYVGSFAGVYDEGSGTWLIPAFDSFDEHFDGAQSSPILISIGQGRTRAEPGGPYLDYVGVSCEASYERVAVDNVRGLYDPPTDDFHFGSWGVAGSDYLFQPVSTSLYDFEFLTYLSPAGGSEFGPYDRIVLYLADMTADDVLLDIDVSFDEYCLVYEYGTPVEPANDVLRCLDLRWYLYDSHVYNLRMFVQPWSAPEYEAWFGSVGLSIQPIPAPDAILCAALGTILVGLLRRRRMLS